MIKQAEFKRMLLEALPNFKTDRAFQVLATNATEEYALIRCQELIGEAMSDQVVFHERLIRAIQLLVIARAKHGNDSTAV